MIKITCLARWQSPNNFHILQESKAISPKNNHPELVHSLLAQTQIQSLEAKTSIQLEAPHFFAVYNLLGWVSDLNLFLSPS